MRRAFVALSGVVLLAGLAHPANADDVERMLQGGFGGYKYQAKERLNISYTNDFNQVGFFYDHNPQMPDGNLMCFGGQLVQQGSRRHFKKARTEAIMATAEGNFDFKPFNLKYVLTDPDDLFPGFSLMFPDFDYDIYLWDKVAEWDRTKSGLTLQQIYTTTAGSNVFFTNSMLNRGKESPGDWTYGTCYAHLGTHEGRNFGNWGSQVASEWLIAAALESRAERLRERPDR
jgi:hypothetical protein